jgi:adenosine deaminase
MNPLSLDDIRVAPKVLLHDHLDGGLRPATVIELADEIGHQLPYTDAGELHRWFIRGAESRDLLQYLETFEHTLAVMQTEEHIERIAYEAGMDLAADGVVYAESRFAPEQHQQRGLPLEAVVEAVQAGFARAMGDSAAAGTPIVVNTILCAMRTAQRSVEIAELAVRMRDRDDRVVAFDLAGAETGWPPGLHAEALEVARHHQLHLTIHASEPPDLELIAEALLHGAERIGHGVRITADIDAETGALGRLARSVLERQIPLELAPTCNVQIGAVPTLADHPIGRLLRMGFMVTVNTDNRLMSDVSVSGEVHAVATAFHLSVDEVARLALNGIDSSFASWSERAALREAVMAGYGSGSMPSTSNR